MKKLSDNELKDLSGGSSDDLWTNIFRSGIRYSTHYVADEMLNNIPG